MTYTVGQKWHVLIHSFRECFRRALFWLLLSLRWQSEVFVDRVLKVKFHYAIWFEAGSKLVEDLQRAEIWPII